MQQQVRRTSDIIRNKICVVGTGAVGLLYGGLLVNASLNNNDNNNNNNDVSFITRGSDYNILTTNGYDIKSKTYGNLHLPSTVFNNYINNNNNNNNSNKFDWIILATKTNSLLSNDLPILLSNLSHENTKILCLMNGLNVEDHITKYNIFKKENGTY
jgi:ketopantoate reductase